MCPPCWNTESPRPAASLINYEQNGEGDESRHKDRLSFAAWSEE